TGADTYHLSLGSNSSGKFVVDTVVDADAATLSGISLTNLKPISAGSNIYKADSNPDVRVILNGSTVTIVQAATKEVIRLEGYVEGSNDFGLTFGEEAEIPDARASSGAFDTTTESFSYNPEDYVIHEGQEDEETIETVAYNLYLPSTSLGVFAAMASTASEGTEAYQLKQWLIIEFGNNLPLGELGKSINYDAA